VSVTRIAIADDNQLVRAGIASLLEDVPGLEVIGEASDGPQALSLVAALRPDVLLLDLVMPGMSGMEVLARVHQEYPQIRVIIISMHADDEFVLRALKLGAAGYILKDVLPNELEPAVRSIEKGDRWFSPLISTTVIDDCPDRTVPVSGLSIA
jgi:DNA-binding NarL/FixJ family response regulator